MMPQNDATKQRYQEERKPTGEPLGSEAQARRCRQTAQSRAAPEGRLRADRRGGRAAFLSQLPSSRQEKMSRVRENVLGDLLVI